MAWGTNVVAVSASGITLLGFRLDNTVTAAWKLGPLAGIRTVVVIIAVAIITLLIECRLDDAVPTSSRLTLAEQRAGIIQTSIVASTVVAFFTRINRSVTAGRDSGDETCYRTLVVHLTIVSAVVTLFSRLLDTISTELIGVGRSESERRVIDNGVTGIVAA